VTRRLSADQAREVVKRLNPPVGQIVVFLADGTVLHSQGERLSAQQTQVVYLGKRADDGIVVHVQHPSAGTTSGDRSSDIR
jgi:hypothetical protein